MSPGGEGWGGSDAVHQPPFCFLLLTLGAPAAAWMDVRLPSSAHSAQHQALQQTHRLGGRGQHVLGSCVARLASNNRVSWLSSQECVYLQLTRRPI